MSAEHDHPLDEDLLELVLRGREARLAGCPQCAQRLEELAQFVGLCRETLAPELALADGDVPAPAQLVERVLAQTTRARPQLSGFVRARLRSSYAFRAAAAALLAHMLALPVLAWLAFREPPPRGSFMSGIEMPAEDPFQPALEEPPGEVDPLVAPDEPLRASDPRPAASPYLKASRAALAGAQVPQRPRAEAPRWGLEGLLAARATLLAGGEVAEFAAEPPPREAELLERALQVELLLDVYALYGSQPQSLPACLEGLRAELGERGGPATAESTLAMLALGRAAASGLLSGRGLPAAERDADPLDAQWRTAFERALLERGGDAPALGRPWTSR